MSNRVLISMTVLVLTGMVILFGLNMRSILHTPFSSQTYLKPNHVSGMAIQHNQLLYTLNFHQQNALIDLINQSVAIQEMPIGDRQKPTIDQIVIYQFDQAPALTITPIAYVDHHLIYLAPQWNAQGYLMDISNGQFQQLLSKTYDP